jgi:hypothetical protein
MSNFYRGCFLELIRGLSLWLIGFLSAITTYICGAYLMYSIVGFLLDNREINLEKSLKIFCLGIVSAFISIMCSKNLYGKKK